MKIYDAYSEPGTRTFICYQGFEDEHMRDWPLDLKIPCEFEWDRWRTWLDWRWNLIVAELTAPTP